MTQFTIAAWAGDRKVHDLITAFGYEDRQEVEGDIFAIAKKFHDAGLNIMITANGKLLALDTKMFTQR